MRQINRGVVFLGVTLCVCLAAATSDADTDPQVLVTPRGDPAPFPHFPAVIALPTVPVTQNPLPPLTFEFAQGVPQQQGLPLVGPVAAAASPIFPVAAAVPTEPPRRRFPTQRARQRLPVVPAVHDLPLHQPQDLPLHHPQDLPLHHSPDLPLHHPAQAVPTPHPAIHAVPAVPPPPPHPTPLPTLRPLPALPDFHDAPHPVHPAPAFPNFHEAPQPIHAVPAPHPFDHPHPVEPVLVPVEEVDIEEPASPNFSYNYGVSDPVTGDQKTHTETRDGDVVRGQYSFVDSDGSIRTVTYTADAEHGFQVQYFK